MQIRLPTRWMLISSLILASVACGDDSSPKCEGEDCGGSNGNGNCDDGKKNGDESDVDCGGSCGECGAGQSCENDDDCGASLGCSMNTGECAEGAKLGFTLSNPEGVVPVVVTATSTATPGSSGAAIATVRYDWGDGSGFVEGETHKYRQGGTFNVRQQVVDANGVSVTQKEGEGQTITITGFEPVRFSESDKQEKVVLSSFNYAAGITEDNANAHGVRTDGAVAPGSGVFYFEAKSMVPVGDDDFSSVGVATPAHPLTEFVAVDERPATPRQAFGVYGNGAIPHTGGTCSGPQVTPTDPGVEHFDKAAKEYGFVVDYRTANNPAVYILLKEADKVIVKRSCTLAVSAPLHVMFSGRRSTIGPQMRINTGADVTNHPFTFSPEIVKAALVEAKADAVAEAVAFGFGKTRTPVENKAPNLTVPAAMTVAANAPVTLMASASDAEDGDLTAEITWTDLSASYSEQGKTAGKGASFTFTPTRVGRFPVEVRISDLDQTTVTKIVMITVDGQIEQNAPAAVRLVPPECENEDCVEVINNGLGIRRRGGLKNGAIANQAIYQGKFWYFEAHREGLPANLGAGLVQAGGDITPYEDGNVAWSMSVNMQTGIWRNLNSVHGYDTTNVNHYGIAVDYRGEHPKVYVFVGNSTTPATARLEHTMELTEIWGPVYPMLYGTMGGTGAAAQSTATINFAGPFLFTNVPALLTAAGSTGVVMHWGQP